MAGDYGLSELRFSGYDPGKLADQVDGLRGGSGPNTLYNAVWALLSLAGGLAETDKTMREQLKEIGVTWQGEAADGGTAATEGATIYAEDAQGPVEDSAKGVGNQSETFTTTRDSAPDSSTLRGPTEESGFDQFAGFLGHTTDHAKQVKATNAAKDQAVDSLNNYQAGSSDALDRSQALPVPPGMNLNVQPVEHGTTTPAVASFNSGGVNTLSGGPGGTGGGSPNPALGSGGGVAPVPTTGGNPLSGPGPHTGIGPNPPGVPAGPAGQLPLAARAVSPLMMAEAATMMGAGGMGGAGAAGADNERTGRGGGQGAQSRAPAKGATPLGSAPDDDARAARNAERYGAKTGRPAGSIMQPAAAAGNRADGEDDKEHVRRYGVESADVFDDDRVVAPESIGDEDDDAAN